jgi:hypothetical protein
VSSHYLHVSSYYYICVVILLLVYYICVTSPLSVSTLSAFSHRDEVGVPWEGGRERARVRGGNRGKGREQRRRWRWRWRCNGRELKFVFGSRYFAYSSRLPPGGAFTFKSAHDSIRQHIISIRQHTSAYVSSPGGAYTSLFLCTSVSVFVSYILCARELVAFGDKRRLSASAY